MDDDLNLIISYLNTEKNNKTPKMAQIKNLDEEM
jgi:hypothetical protein